MSRQRRGRGREERGRQGRGRDAAAGGPTTTFAVTVKDVKRKQLPELDDDFAKSLGDHDTLAALTDTVRARLAEEALRSARVATENRVVDAPWSRPATRFQSAWWRRRRTPWGRSAASP